MKPLILTYTGLELDPTNIRQEDICIEDIAHALGQCNRFAGHTRKPISVAQHSVFVSRLCDDGLDALQGLLHDASEAYIGDVTKWVKAQPGFAAYRELEDRLQRTIYRAFDCPEEMSPIVALADKLMLRWEGEMGFGTRVWTSWLERIGYDICTIEEADRIRECNRGKFWRPWTWREAETAFLLQYRALTAVA